MSYRIRTVVDLTGVPRNTLLAWERRYGVPTPDRTDGGHRVYSEDDVQLLRRLVDLIDQGHRVGEAIALLRRTGEPARAAGELPIDRHRQDLGDALLDFDRAAADQTYHLLGSFPIRRIIDDVLMPLLREIGDGWHAGTVSIAQEHFASAFIREQLITMLHRLESGPKGGPVAICAGFPGESHEIPLLAVAVKLALRGWRVVYLGASLPLEELGRLLQTRSVELVCQSLITEREPAAIRDHAIRLLQLTSTPTRIVVGGPGAAPHGALSTDRMWFVATFDDMVDRLDQVVAS